MKKKRKEKQACNQNGGENHDIETKLELSLGLVLIANVKLQRINFAV